MCETVIYGFFSVAQTALLAADYETSLHAAARILNLIDIVEEERREFNQIVSHRMIDCRGAIEFENVQFSYPSRPSALVARNLTFSVGVGERVAIVGPSGVGKSTALQLLMRFYEPLGGKIVFCSKVKRVMVN